MISVGFDAAATNYKTVGRTVRCVNKGSNYETVIGIGERRIIISDLVGQKR